MGFELSDVSGDILDSLSKKLHPLVKNAVSTAILIVIVLILVTMFTYDYENGIIKMAFWTLLSTMIILFIHDNVVRDDINDNISAQKMDEIRYVPPNGLKQSDDKAQIIGKKEPSKISLPVLSAVTAAKPTNPNYHNMPNYAA